MILLMLNVGLAIGWALLNGSLTVGQLLFGFVVGYAALWIARPLHGHADYFSRLPRVLRLIGFFHYELVVSSIRVVWDVVTPPILARPGIIAVPLEPANDGEIFLLSSLVSLTPGTLSLDVSDDRRTLYVHAMFADDPEDVRQSVKEGMERRVLAVTR